MRADSWGPPFNGNRPRAYTPAQERLRQQVLDGGMSKRKARTVIENLDPNSPFRSIDAYLESMAAITSQFWDEVDRKTASGRQLYQVLHSSTSPEKTHFYFNNSRMRHSVRRGYQALLGSGTSPNEAARACEKRGGEAGYRWYSIHSLCHGPCSLERPRGTSSSSSITDSCGAFRLAAARFQEAVMLRHCQLPEIFTCYPRAPGGHSRQGRVR